jgi:CheY-like chemotaxis protein
MTRTDEILYVDDSPDDRFFASLSFQRGRYAFELTIMETAAAALADMESRIALGLPLPSLLVADHYMPAIDGPELLRLFHADARLADVALAMCSGSDDPADTLLAKKAGARFLLDKPLDLDLCQDILDHRHPPPA